MSAVDVVVATFRGQAALDAGRAQVEQSADATLAYVDDAVLTLAVEPVGIASEELRTRLAALDGVDAAYVKPPDALP